jgi:hypothetical protein
MLRRVSVRALGAGETRVTLSRAVLVSAPIAAPAMKNADAIVARRVFEARLRFMIDLPSFFAFSSSLSRFLSHQSPPFQGNSRASS